MVAYPPSSAPTVEAAVTRAISRVVGEGEGTRAKALKAALTDAQQRTAESSQ